jgi:hypothetical protein
MVSLKVDAIFDPLRKGRTLQTHGSRPWTGAVI